VCVCVCVCVCSKFEVDLKKYEIRLPLISNVLVFDRDVNRTSDCFFFKTISPFPIMSVFT